MTAPGNPGRVPPIRADRPDEVNGFFGDKALEQRRQRENSAAIDDLLRRAYARLRGVFRRG